MSEDLYFMGHKSSNNSSDGHGDDISVAVLPLTTSTTTRWHWSTPSYVLGPVLDILRALNSLNPYSNESVVVIIIFII